MENVGSIPISTLRGKEWWDFVVKRFRGLVKKLRLIKITEQRKRVEGKIIEKTDIK